MKHEISPYMYTIRLFVDAELFHHYDILTNFYDGRCHNLHTRDCQFEFIQANLREMP
jgi:hypothetical protein